MSAHIESLARGPISRRQFLKEAEIAAAGAASLFLIPPGQVDAAISAPTTATAPQFTEYRVGLGGLSAVRAFVEPETDIQLMIGDELRTFRAHPYAARIGETTVKGVAPDLRVMQQTLKAIKAAQRDARIIPVRVNVGYGVNPDNLYKDIVSPKRHAEGANLTPPLEDSGYRFYPFDQWFAGENKAMNLRCTNIGDRMTYAETSLKGSPADNYQTFTRTDGTSPLEGFSSLEFGKESLVDANSWLASAKSPYDHISTVWLCQAQMADKNGHTHWAVNVGVNFMY